MSDDENILQTVRALREAVDEAASAVLATTENDYLAAAAIMGLLADDDEEGAEEVIRAHPDPRQLALALALLAIRREAEEGEK